MGWSRIGGPAGEVYDSLQDLSNPMLFKTDPSEDPIITGAIYVLTPAGWERIGDPASMFAVNDRSLIRLSPNKDKVFEWIGYSDRSRGYWNTLGGPANTIIAGDGAVALYTDQNGLHMYNVGKIGGRGYMFAVSGSRDYVFQSQVQGEGFDIYGVTENQMQIWRFETSEHWEHLTEGNQLGVRPVDANGTGIRIRSITAGVRELYAVVETVYAYAPVSANIYRYGGTPGNWTKIGSGLGVGHLAIQMPSPRSEGMSDVLFSFNPNDRSLRRYTGSDWQVINWPRQNNPPLGPGADRDIQRIFSGYGRILLTLSDDDLWELSSD